MMQRFVITLTASDQGDVPAVIRLRRFLKMALRSFRLRCVRVEPGIGDTSYDRVVGGTAGRKAASHPQAGRGADF